MKLPSFDTNGDCRPVFESVVEHNKAVCVWIYERRDARAFSVEVDALQEPVWLEDGPRKAERLSIEFYTEFGEAMAAAKQKIDEILAASTLVV